MSCDVPKCCCLSATLYGIETNVLSSCASTVEAHAAYFTSSQLKVPLSFLMVQADSTCNTQQSYSITWGIAFKTHTHTLLLNLTTPNMSDSCSSPFNSFALFITRATRFSHRPTDVCQQRKDFKETWIVFQLLQEETKAQMLKPVHSTVCHTFRIPADVFTGAAPWVFSRIIASASPVHLNVWFKTHIPEGNTIFIHFKISIFIVGMWHLFNDSLLFPPKCCVECVWKKIYTKKTDKCEQSDSRGLNYIINIQL